MTELTKWLESRFPELVREPAGAMRHPYLTLGSHYGACGLTFLWDAFFEAVRLWHEGEEYADAIRGTAECFLDTVDLGTGLGKRIIGPQGDLIRSEEQMQPFLCQLTYLSNLICPFAERREEILSILAATLEFWQRERSTTHGLCRWLDSFESGVDMNPAVDRCPPLTVVGVDLNVYLVLEYRALGKLAGTWGNTELAGHCTGMAERLRENIVNHLWNEQAGVFCNVDTRSGGFILSSVDGFGDELNILPWTNFTPLYAGIATPQQAHEMIERYLLNTEAFRCRYGFRTFDKRSVFYTEQRVCVSAYLPHRPSQPTGSNWMGPVWVLSNYMLAHGLANYGYKHEALEVAGETSELCRLNIQQFGGMFENYHPDTGAGLWARDYLSWNILADVMATEIDTGQFALKELVSASKGS